CWDEECRKASKKQRDPSFAKAIIRCYRKPHAWLGLITFIEVPPPPPPPPKKKKPCLLY
ncbi:hypothetical protein NHX12_014805, partial [Muraenolepis orangiensis]